MGVRAPLIVDDEARGIFRVHRSVFTDDLEVVEACQRGYETVKEVAYSDVSRGMTRSFANDLDELQMRAFWRQWAHLMDSPISTAMLEDQLRPTEVL